MHTHTQNIFQEYGSMYCNCRGMCASETVPVCVCVFFWCFGYESIDRTTIMSVIQPSLTATQSVYQNLQKQQQNVKSEITNANNKYDNHANKQQNSIPPILLISPRTHTNTEKAYQNSNRK